MSSLEIITRELKHLELSDLWVVLERVQAQIKETVFPAKPAKKHLQWKDFNFEQARAGTSTCEVNLSEAVIQERRSYL